MGLTKTYQVDGRAVQALSDLSIAFARSSFSVLVGPSGCGKTTLLRLLAGLETPNSGRIEHSGAEASRDQTSSGMRIGYVFQEPRLMPWLSVARNVGFWLEGRLEKPVIAAKVRGILAIMGLSAFAQARPHQLSGGMASRVGLARALVTGPDLLLLDEPFAALDAMTRRRLQRELVDLWQRLAPTVVFVTHDVEEATLLGDAIYRMDRGRIAAEYRNSLPRPREATDPHIVAIRRTILDDLEDALEHTPIQTTHSHLENAE